jgi:5-methylcytosine-specific restriction endonuclease McrA
MVEETPGRVTSLTDPVLLAQRLAALLEGGRRVATYKLATLLALLDACAEASPTPGPDDAVAVSILDLADRVIELYWPQVRTYGDHGVLRQSTQSRALILTEVMTLQARAAQLGARTTGGLQRLDPESYQGARHRVALTLARQPLPALQTPSGVTQAHVPFLYDDSWLGYSISRSTLAARAWTLELLPGVADGLVRLGGLLRPVVERAWIDDVARHNHLAPEHELLTGFLFGAERSSLLRAAAVLRELEGSRCFYCGTAVGAGAQVDHFLPWARVPFNGLANLVLTDARCNGSKSDSLASLEHRARWLDRDRTALEQAGDDLRWPAEWERGQRIAQGLYARLPTGTPLWQAVGTYALS